MAKYSTNCLRIILGLTVSFGIFYFLGKYAIESNFFNNQNKTLLESEWVFESYGNPEISLLTPVKLNAQPLTVPADARGMIEKLESYNYTSDENFQIMINLVTYTDNISANLQGSADGSVNQMKQMTGIQNFSFQEEDFMLPNMPGKKQTGNYVLQGKEIKFENVLFTKANHLWQVTIQYKKGDGNGQKKAKKILESIRVNI